MGKNIFRFNHPEEAAKLREQNSANNSSTNNINNHMACSLSVKSQSMPTLFMKNDLATQSLYLKE